jgi:hypothetical protein
MGVYYLALSRGDYAGFWIGLDAISGKVIQCPYVLSDTENNANETCEGRWPHVFSEATACREVNLP